uniref:Uncharacterized protein n=1 Tax=Knipowitschia caucasica TaxID=637954 RepID=A0AAV2M4X0_KNICA
MEVTVHTLAEAFHLPQQEAIEKFIKGPKYEPCEFKMIANDLSAITPSPTHPSTPPPPTSPQPSPWTTTPPSTPQTPPGPGSKWNPTGRPSLGGNGSQMCHSLEERSQVYISAAHSSACVCRLNAFTNTLFKPPV